MKTEAAPPPLDLAGRVALVTGSSRGIGRAIALHLARRGAVVHVNHPGDDGERAGGVVREIRAGGGRAEELVFDVSEPVQVREGLASLDRRWGRLDIAVNNAGICPFRDFDALDLPEWLRVFSVNAAGPFLVSQAASRIMRRARWGRIVNVTSISGIHPTSPLQVAYAASKAAANMLTKSLAVILAPLRITVNAVLPGTVPTELNRDVLAAGDVEKNLVARTPLKRLGAPDDVAQAVGYLASPSAEWVTGTLLVVDGGFAA